MRVSLNTTTGRFEFDPYGATPGTYPVTYTYTNTYGCPSSPPAVAITIQANPFSCGGTLTDVRDGKPYQTSLIGGRCWMTENLVFGTTIQTNVPSTDNCINEKYCPPGDADCSTFGGLYQWDEVMRYGYTSANQGLCPPGWHLPSEGEFQALLNAVEPNVNPPDGISGSYLKDQYLAGGFRALPGGMLYLDYLWSFYTGSVNGTMFWTSTTSGSDRAIARGVNSINPSTSRYAGSLSDGFSVRCVRD
jgi:uncharacterized protein (TIGR02145 family)